MRAIRLATQRACASDWHLGQCRLRPRVVRRLGVATRKTHVQMAAQHGGAATMDGAKRGDLVGSQPMGASERLAVLADDVRNLDDGARRRTGGRAAVHSFSAGGRCGLGARRHRRQLIERADQASYLDRAHVQVGRRASERAVPEYDLQRA